MTLTGYVKPQMFLTFSRPSTNHPPLSLNLTLHSLLCFSRLQGMSINAFQVGILRLSRFLPSQRSHCGTSQPVLPDSALPVLGFFQPLDRFFALTQLAGLFHPACTPRVLPSKYSRKTIGVPSRDPCSFIVSSPAWLPSISKSDISQHLDRAGLPRRDLNLPIAPSCLHSRLPSWKLAQS
jgi:hypothetical protein